MTKDLEITVAYMPYCEPGRWRDSHRAGLVPGTSPYGLLNLPGWPIQGAVLPSLGKSTGAWVKALVHLTVGTRKRRHVSDVTLVWDEGNVSRAVTSRRYRKSMVGSGVIWATDDWQRRTNRFKSEIVRFALRQVSFIWVLSRAQVEPTRSKLGKKSPPVHFLRFGIDTGFFRLTPPPDSGPPMILSVGNDRDRDTPTLLKAFELVREQRPDAILMFQSGDSAVPPDGVTRIPRVPASELRDLYVKATAIAIATVHNLHGSGMTTALEAMSTGRLVVATNTPGMEDYVQDGITGDLCAVGDARALANKLLTAINDPARAFETGILAARHVRENHSEASMLAELRNIIRMETEKEAFVS